MSRTISNAVPGPVVLVATDNPLTITSSGSVISTTGTAHPPVDAMDGGFGTSCGPSQILALSPLLSATACPSPARAP